MIGNADAPANFKQVKIFVLKKIFVPVTIIFIVFVFLVIRGIVTGSFRTHDAYLVAPCLFLLIAAAWRITYVVLKYYRCPSCGKVPTNMLGRIELDPKSCKHCKAVLK